MTGERLAWFRVASHLHRTIEELKAVLTYSEFLEWVEFLSVEEGTHQKLDYYLAQIAAEIRRGLVKSPQKVKLQEFLLKFQAREKPPQTKEEAAKRSRSVWSAVLGLKKGKS